MAHPKHFEVLGLTEQTIPLICPAQWQGQNVPSRIWILDEWIPALRATYLTGDGGTGKSLLAQQLATCAALGLPFMGIAMRKQRAIYLTCEDDMAELHRRQRGINAALGIDMEDLDGELFLSSRAGEMENSLLHFDPDTVHESEFLEKLRGTCNATASHFLVLDNVAHRFSGNENVRQHVAIFCSALDKLARDIGGTVLFLGHPSKGGAQYSGSTAWENQVRSRLFLSRPDAENGGSNPNVRTLARSKSNYAALGTAIDMQWHEWGFVELDDSRANWVEDVETVRRKSTINERFIECLKEATAQKRPVSSSSHAQNFAPKMFAQMPAGRGTSADEFRAAMERLFHLHAIEEGDLWLGTDRKYKKGLRVVESGAGRLRDGSQQMPTDHSATRENPCGTVAKPDCGTVAGQLRVGGSQVIENICGMVAGQSIANQQGDGAGGSPYRGDPPAPFAADEGDGFDD